MIHAVMWRTADGRYSGYQLKGHSGYAAAGEDIVCAAASTLAINCANSMETICRFTPIVSGGEDGYLRVLLPAGLSAEQAHDAQVLLRALHQGLHDLHEEYPDYMSVPVIERREYP